MNLRNGLLRTLILFTLFAATGCGTKPAPDFKAEPLYSPGRTVSLRDYQGKAVLLEFWATWCAPCRATMAVIDEVYSEYHPQGLEVVSVTSESREVVEKFSSEAPVQYPLFLDTGGAISQTYQVTAIPDCVVIGKNGTIVWRGNPADVQALVVAVEKALEH